MDLKNMKGKKVIIYFDRGSVVGMIILGKD